MAFGGRVKKLQWHSTFGDLRVEKIQYRLGSQHLRPFANRAKVRHRGCSRPFQRVVTDFGADVAFAQVEDKLVEHNWKKDALKIGKRADVLKSLRGHGGVHPVTFR